MNKNYASSKSLLNLDDSTIELDTKEMKFFHPENRFVCLSEAIDPKTSLKVIDDLYFAAAVNNIPVVLLMNCPGGDAYSTLSLIDAIQAMPVPVIGVTMGLAGSGAFYALQACNHRVMFKNSILFWHEMIREDDGIARSGAEAEKKMKDYKKLNDHILTFFKKKINISSEDWKKNFEGKNDLSFNSNEALKMKLTDKVITKMSQLQIFFKQFEKENK